MLRGERTMPPANCWQQQFGQLSRIVFGRVILRPKIAQGFAHDLAGIGIAPRPDFPGDEILEVFCQRQLHRCIFPQGIADVNRDNRMAFRSQSMRSKSWIAWRWPPTSPNTGWPWVMLERWSTSMKAATVTKSNSPPMTEGQSPWPESPPTKSAPSEARKFTAPAQ